MIYLYRNASHYFLFTHTIYITGLHMYIFMIELDIVLKIMLPDCLVKPIATYKVFYCNHKYVCIYASFYASLGKFCNLHTLKQHLEWFSHQIFTILVSISYYVLYIYIYKIIVYNKNYIMQPLNYSQLSSQTSDYCNQPSYPQKALQ